jgi:hypothetical protein
MLKRAAIILGLTVLALWLGNTSLFTIAKTGLG